MGIYLKGKEGGECLTVAGSALILLTQLILWDCVLNMSGGGGSPAPEALVLAPHLCRLLVPSHLCELSSLWLGLVLVTLTSVPFQTVSVLGCFFQSQLLYSICKSL